MAGEIDARLKALGIDLPAPAKPVANYVPFVRTGNLVFISGQVTMSHGELRYVGKVGKEVNVEDAKKAARLCGINILSNLKAALDGDLDKVVRCVKLVGFVNAIDSFTQQPEVVNGCSDLMVEVFGDKGRHARSAVGSGSLPRNVAVEVEAIFEVT